MSSETTSVLAIDRGNTRTKVTLFAGDHVALERTFDRLDIEDLLPLFDGTDIDGAVFCSVAGIDSRYAESLRRLMRGDALVLTHGTPLPVEIDYGTPATLGLDRVAAAAGAAALWPGEAVLVADAGTALTLDVVDARGVFRGGNISPGVTMRLEALHASTGRLPLVAADGPLPEFGHDTDTAIRAGAVGGLLAEVRAAFAAAAERYGCRRLVLAGGDALSLAGHLEAGGGLAGAVSVEPRLVARGLLAIYRHAAACPARY